MKERLKMIFDRIDIFVVCIVVCLCLCIAEGFIGNRDAFADFVIVTLLISEVCYTNRCKEKLEIELIETKEKLKEAEKESDTAIHPDSSVSSVQAQGSGHKERYPDTRTAQAFAPADNLYPQT